MQYLVNLYHHLDAEVITLIIMIVSCVPVMLFIKKLIFAPIRRYLAAHHYDNYEKILKKYNIFRYLMHSVLGIYFIFLGNIFPLTSFGLHLLVSIKNSVVGLYTSVSLTLLVLAIFNAITDLYSDKIKTYAKNAPIGLYFQIVRIVIISVSSIITISYLLDISPSKFLTSLGAAAALLTFLFKDMLVGLLASLQLASQDIINIGDSIRVGSIEGTVEKITISVVTIRNFDQSISTIPTANILNSNVVNYRGINEAGAKRIQRALNINMTTIQFCEHDLLETLKKSPHISRELLNNIILDKNDKLLTNIKLFKLYTQEYLKAHPSVYTEGFTFLVRQLDPTPVGLPIEVYVFVRDVSSVGYENIKANIFEHLISVLPEFQLKIFQTPSV